MEPATVAGFPFVAIRKNDGVSGRNEADGREDRHEGGGVFIVRDRVVSCGRHSPWEVRILLLIASYSHKLMTVRAQLDVGETSAMLLGTPSLGTTNAF